MIDKFVKNTAREVSIDYIQKVVCDYFDLPIELLKSKTRKREIVQARQIAMYFAKKMTKSSLANIDYTAEGKTTRQYYTLVVRLTISAKLTSTSESI